MTCSFRFNNFGMEKLPSSNNQLLLSLLFTVGHMAKTHESLTEIKKNNGTITQDSLIVEKLKEYRSDLHFQSGIGCRALHEYLELEHRTDLRVMSWENAFFSSI